MAANAAVTFFSYSREDAEFALQLAGDLKSAGEAVWIDQLDIHPGQRWDRAVEDALRDCPLMIVILSPASINSMNVLDEVSFALESKKTVLPILYRDCEIPFRLRRVQRLDFRKDYSRMLQVLRQSLGSGGGSEHGSSSTAQITPASTPAAVEQQASAEASPDAKNQPNAAEIRAFLGTSRQGIEAELGTPNQIAGDVIMYLHPCVGFNCPDGIATLVEYYRPNTVVPGLDTGMTRAMVEQSFGPGEPPSSGPSDWARRSREYPALLPGFGLKVLYDDYDNPSAIATMIQVWLAPVASNRG